MDRNERIAAVRAASGKIRNGGISEALGYLRYKRGTIVEFKPVRVVDDGKFAEEHPDHPQADPQRFIRIEAADRIKELAKTSPHAFETQQIAALHEALFDRDAAVRLSIVESLAILARVESRSVMQRLLEIEDESEWVRNAVRNALKP